MSNAEDFFGLKNPEINQKRISKLGYLDTNEPIYDEQIQDARDSVNDILSIITAGSDNETGRLWIPKIPFSDSEISAAESSSTQIGGFGVTEIFSGLAEGTPNATLTALVSSAAVSAAQEFLNPNDVLDGLQGLANAFGPRPAPSPNSNASNASNTSNQTTNTPGPVSDADDAINTEGNNNDADGDEEEDEEDEEIDGNEEDDEEDEEIDEVGNGGNNASNTNASNTNASNTPSPDADPNTSPDASPDLNPSNVSNPFNQTANTSSPDASPDLNASNARNQAPPEVSDSQFLETLIPVLIALMKSAPGGAGVYVTVPYLLSFLEKLRIFEISDANEDNASRLTDEQIKQLQTIRTELAPLIQRRKEIEIQLKKEKTYGSKALFELQKSELQRERKSTIEKAEGVGLPIMKKPSGSILARHPELESTYRTYEEDVKRKYEINRTKISEVIKLKREKKK